MRPLDSVPPAILRIGEECFLHYDCAALSNIRNWFSLLHGNFEIPFLSKGCIVSS